MAAKRTTTGLDALIFVASLAGILVCANILATHAPLRWDLTEEKRYTLSDATRRLVGSLDREVLIKGYFSPDLQPPFHDLERGVRDLLDEYVAASNGRIRVEFANPEDDEELKDEAAGFGIHPVRADFVGRTKVELRAVFKGVALVCADRQEVMGDLGPNENLEYLFTDALKRVTSEEEGKPAIGFVGGHGELIDMQGVQRAFQELFGDRYQIKTVQADAGPIDDDVAALIVLNPTQMVSERAKFEIDQFLMKGKAVAFLLSTVAQDRRFPIGRANPVVTTIEELVGHYGVKVKREIVLDQENSTQMLMATPQGFVVVNNPLALVTGNINRSEMMVKHLPALSLPFSSPLEFDEGLVKKAAEQKDKPGEGTPDKQPLRLSVLVASEPSARTRANVSDIMPGPDSDLLKALPGDGVPGEEAPEGLRPGFPIAVTVLGPFESHYKGKEIPAPAPPKQGQAPPPKPDDSGRQIIESTGSARIFVMGSGEFLISRNRLQRSSIVFLQNLIDWLVQDEDLIAIRSKGSIRPLEPVDEATSIFYKYGNILGVPLLFVLFGVVRWQLRKRRRHALFATTGESVDPDAAPSKGEAEADSGKEA